MASTLPTGTLKVQIIETITAGGRTVKNLTTTSSVTTVEGYEERPMRVLSSAETTLLTFGTAVGAGVFITANVKYIRITNADDTNFIRLRMIKASADTVDFNIPAGRSFTLHNSKISANVSGGAFSAFTDITSITARADTADVDVEIFIANSN